MHPQSPWSTDPKEKELGLYNEVNVLEGIGTYSYALFSRYLGWTKQEIDALVANVRQEIKDTNHHLYTNAYFVVGQKP